MTGLAVLGVGETSLGKHPERTSLDLVIAASLDAIADAGLSPGDIQGVLTPGTRTADLLVHSALVAEELGLRPSFTRTIGLGGAAHCAALIEAEAAIRAGQADYVLITAGDNLASAMSREAVAGNLGREGAAHPETEHRYGATIPALYALCAARYLHEYGADERDLAAVAVTMREHAARHPGAHKRDPITIEDVLGSPVIAAPLKLLDCCPVSDGAGAIVVGRARPGDARAVRVLGVGEQHDGAYLSSRADLVRTAAKESGQRAYEMAGIGPDDIDVAFLYDSFTIALLVQLEDLGFCERGGAGELVRSGELSLSGRLPTNTHGGLLSHGHPGKAGGLFHLVEAVRQLRGEADTRQVAGARHALVHGSAGALVNHATAILAGAG